MKRRKRPKPLPGWNPPTEPMEVIEMVSDEEKAGHPLPPLVELRPGGPPVEIVEGYPNPLPALRQPRPFDRAEVLAKLQAAFALLTDEELQVAQMRMLGAPFLDISEALALRQERIIKLWKQARRKMGRTIFPETPASLTSPALTDPPANTGTPQETEGTSPA